MSKLPFTFAEPEQPQATFADLAREFAWDIASGDLRACWSRGNPRGRLCHRRRFGGVLVSRPSLKTPCVADRYADKARERIAEFDGGLIALRRQDDGTLLVSLYQLDQNVKVTVAASHLIQTQPAAAATTMLAALKRAAFVMESPAFPQSLINGGGALDDVRAAIAAAEGRAP